MNTLTATEAARHFSEVLDAVEHDHETFLVSRGGQTVAAIGPALGGGGRGLKSVLLNHRLDTAWRGELRTLRNGLVSESRTSHG